MGMNTGFGRGSNSLIFVFLISIILISPVNAGDDKRNHPSISGLETGFYLVFTVNLEQIMSLRKPKVHTEVYIYRTTFAMDEIKSCWITGMKSCFRNHTEDYVDKFVDFYAVKNQKSKEGDYLRLIDAKVEESLQRGFPHGIDRKSVQVKNQSSTDGRTTLKAQVLLPKTPSISRK